MATKKPNGRPGEHPETPDTEDSATENGRAARAAETVRRTAGQAWHKTGDLTGQARQAATDHPVPPAVRYLGAAAAGGAVVAVTIWAWQRRQARRATRWQRATRTAQHTAAQLRDTAAQLLEQAGELTATVKDSDLATTAAGRARAIAADPATAMRAQGAATTAALAATARRLRHRARQATPSR